MSAPNLGSIANDLQSISRNFSTLCLELSKLENLPSVELLTQIKTLNDSVSAKEEIRKVADSVKATADSVKAAEEGLDKRLDALFADVKAVKGSVESLQNRLSAVEKAQAAQNIVLTTTDAHVSAVENNCYARYKNSKNSGYYNRELVGFRSNDNKVVANFPANSSDLDRLSANVVDSIIKALNLSISGDERQRRDTLKSWLGRE